MPSSLALACGLAGAGLAAQVEVDVSTTYQTMEGFGGAVAYYQNWLTAHPNKEKIYDAMFSDLGLSILRFRNSFYSSSADLSDETEIASAARSRLDGGLPKIMLSSWSPPPELKSNGDINGGTLATKDGKFVYDEFGQWWANSLKWFSDAGIEAEYISIQNEPDMDAGYDSCRFDPDESAGLPSYSHALNATMLALKNASLPVMPKVLGPEVLGIGYGNVEKYTKTMDMDSIWGLAHHNYHGGDETQPDSFNAAFGQLASEYSAKPRLMTEYFRGDWMQTACIVHNSLAVEEVSAYIFWDLTWGGSGHMIELDNPWDISQWRNDDGFQLDRTYFAFKQYARFVQPGWSRVKATADDAAVKVTAFLSPTDDLSIVLVNPGNATSITLDVAHLPSQFTGAIYQTTGTINCTQLGTYSVGSDLGLPSKSITTITTLKDMDIVI